jgi:hypothetical protein
MPRKSFYVLVFVAASVQNTGPSAPHSTIREEDRTCKFHLLRGRTDPVNNDKKCLGVPFFKY